MAYKLVVFSFAVLVVAVLISWYNPTELKYAFFSPLSSVFSFMSVVRSASQVNKGNTHSETDTKKGGKLFTVEELALSKTNPIFLGILGKVFDVTNGERHYGPDGGYHFFAGRDATRAFISGDFTEEGLIDDIEGLKPSEALEIQTWVEFYEKEYVYLGKLVGTYYDASGKPTEKLKAARHLIAEGKKEKAANEADKRRFPPCNSEWSQKKGTRIWCSNRSGGIARDWEGFPRKYFQPGAKSFRCGCVQEKDLDNPHFKEYDNCSPRATSCKLLTKNE